MHTPEQPEQAASQEFAAFQSKDKATSARLAARSVPDAWLAADELGYRGEHDAAETFARAAPRALTAKLPAHVVSQRGRDTHGKAREAPATVKRSLARGDAKGATKGLVVQAPMDTVIGVQLTIWPGIFLRGMDRKEDAQKEYVGDTVLLGSAANERDLRTSLEKRLRWRAVHFACHGLIDRTAPSLSSLALSRSEGHGGFLTARALVRSHEKRKHPYDWAAWVLWGLSE